ncbi:MAG: signal peptidase I [Defluviitaleaceae bacterium]|nr:signal peptidase I [Defluviitaleaceae bacterium]
MHDFEPKTTQDVLDLANGSGPDAPIDMKEEILAEVFSMSKIIVVALICAMILNFLVIVNATVPTGSMEPTIRVNDRIVAFRLSYLFSSPDRYDIIVFRAPDDGVMNVKRVIALPGETVRITGGVVYINGASGLRDDFIRTGPMGYMGADFPEMLVPEGHFFVLGDYRGNSRDSRDWNNPFVEAGRIQGRAVFRYFPGFRNLRNS